jgi:hypothetical protein
LRTQNLLQHDPYTTECALIEIKKIALVAVCLEEWAAAWVVM